MEREDEKNNRVIDIYFLNASTNFSKKKTENRKQVEKISLFLIINQIWSMKS